MCDLYNQYFWICFVALIRIENALLRPVRKNGKNVVKTVFQKRPWSVVLARRILSTLRPIVDRKPCHHPISRFPYIDRLQLFLFNFPVGYPARLICIKTFKPFWKNLRILLFSMNTWHHHSKCGIEYKFQESQ